jgi:N-acetylglucosamine-6-sulfatase
VLHHRLPRRPSARGTSTVLVAAALLMSALVLPVTAAAAPGSGGSGKDRRPNVLLITTDDQTLADLKYMPRTRRLIGNAGVTFEGISPHPLCCPARAEILTGQFAQNNGVRSNRGRYGGYGHLDEGNTIATWLKRAGYYNVFMGKFLNGYTRDSDNGPAPGWNDWNPTVGGVYEYRNFTVRHNRRVRSYDGRYQTDFFTDLAVQKLRGASKQDKPFFLWQSYVAPHAACPPIKETERCWVPPMAATRHRTMFQNAKPPLMDTKAFNEQDVSDKPAHISRLQKLDRKTIGKLLTLHRRRLQSLQAVDQGIARMFGTLRRTGELRNTLVIFTSDNGFLLGEHRYSGKVLPYEQSLKVPLMMRGPGVPKGVVRRKVATTVDIAPTITRVAKADPRLTMDGRNLIPVARGRADSWDTVLVQAGPERPLEDPFGWFYRGVRTARYTYAQYLFTGEEELYDRRHDPLQLDNVLADPEQSARYDAILQELKRRTRVLGRCSGADCRQSFAELPAPLPVPDVPDDSGSTPPTEPPTEPEATS